MDRFSEDLDFVLKDPDTSFNWKKYLDAIQEMVDKRWNWLLSLEAGAKAAAAEQKQEKN